jgi:hypothetical protein
VILKKIAHESGHWCPARVHCTLSLCLQGHHAQYNAALSAAVHLHSSAAVLLVRLVALARFIMPTSIFTSPFEATTFLPPLPHFEALEARVRRELGVNPGTDEGLEYGRMDGLERDQAAMYVTVGRGRSRHGKESEQGGNIWAVHALRRERGGVEGVRAMQALDWELRAAAWELGRRNYTGAMFHLDEGLARQGDVRTFVAEIVRSLHVETVCARDEVKSWNVGRWVASALAVFLPLVVNVVVKEMWAAERRRGAPIGRRGPIMTQ